MDRGALNTALSLLRRHSGNDFSQYQVSLVLARMQRRMRRLGCTTLRDYARQLRRDENEREALFRDLLIGATGFFRDPESYATLRHTLLPGLLARRPAGEALRIWIPGCASGEEVYSVAITVLEHLRGADDGRAVRIFGTDIDARAIATACRGVYSALRLEAVSANHRQRYFGADPGGFRVTPWLRAPCLFAVHNLLRDPPFARLDLILCRNLLLYLNPAARTEVLQRLHRVLREDGLLILGNTETLDLDVGGFLAEDHCQPIYRRSADPVRTDRSPSHHEPRR